MPETVLKYAPLVYLHPDEKYWPENPQTFINNSSLNWFHEGGCDPHTVAPRGTVQAGRLGADSTTPYVHSPVFVTGNGAPCAHIPGIEFRASDYTRPWDGSERSNAERTFFLDSPFYEKEGFYLDQDDNDEIRQGIKSIPGNPLSPGPPVFYEYVPKHYVTYWFFYAYDEFSEGPKPIQYHEGDWERISIQLDPFDTPVNIFYYTHGDGELTSWQTVDKYEGIHPVVYSAKGSHASYLSEGVQKELRCYLGVCAHDSTGRGTGWLTWENLQKVEAQPWYGFGGAWGQVDASKGKDYTGPLGPSGYKNSREKWFPSISGRVTALNGSGLAEVTIKAFDAQGNKADEATTCNDPAKCNVGYYSLKNLVFGRSYTIVPSTEVYGFTPAFRTFIDLRETQTADFKVLDVTPPVLHLPSDMAVNASIPQGATIYYTVTATDDGTKYPHIACTPLPGTLFSIGTTTVGCTATDDAGNSSNGTFKVTVKGAADQLNDLIAGVKEFNLPGGAANSLVVKLQSALAKTKAGNKAAACNQLSAFINEVQAQYGKKISATQANQMLIAANRIRAVIGCR